MKKNVRNALAISGLALAIGASGLTLTASANTNAKAYTQRSHNERILRTKKTKTEKINANRRIMVGTVKTVGDNSITLTSGTKEYTINTTTQTRLLNHTWRKIALSDIKEGNRIRVFGTISDNIITAKTIRDISLRTSARK